MACCVLLAAVLGAIAAVTSWLAKPARRPGKAQDWRLIKPTDTP
ncbi:hypothetical protein [Massilia genomosp. 1]|nr:hypothetical protein [Massilia genomosp. 1]